MDGERYLSLSAETRYNLKASTCVVAMQHLRVAEPYSVRQNCLKQFKLMPMSNIHEDMMRLALEQAASAVDAGEVPIGAVLVDAEGNVLAAASNRTIAGSDPTAHAEILCLRAAAAAVNNYRLPGTTLYTTVEPCVMCAGALVNARISHLVYGTADERFGAVRTKFALCDSPLLNHRMQITDGVLAEDCRRLMQEFFRLRR